MNFNIQCMLAILLLFFSLGWWHQFKPELAEVHFCKTLKECKPNPDQHNSWVFPFLWWGRKASACLCTSLTLLREWQISAFTAPLWHPQAIMGLVLGFRLAQLRVRIAARGTVVLLVWRPSTLCSLAQAHSSPNATRLPIILPINTF